MTSDGCCEFGGCDGEDTILAQFPPLILEYSTVEKSRFYYNINRLSKNRLEVRLSPLRRTDGPQRARLPIRPTATLPSC